MAAPQEQFPDLPDARLYDPRLVRAALTFLNLRSEPDRLPEIVHPAFHEHEPATWVDGRKELITDRAGLQRYRDQFRGGVRIGGLYLPVPFHRRWTVPGTNEPFSVGVILEDVNRLPDGTEFTIRMREEIEVVEDDDMPHGLAVLSRLYRAIGSYGLLGGEGAQHDFADEQMAYAHQHGERMPLERTIEEIHEDPATYQAP